MNEIESHVLDIIGEDSESPDVFTDISPIRDSINDAIEEISMIKGINKKTYYMPLTQGVNFYRLDFTSGHLVWIDTVWLYGIKRRLEQKDFIWIVNYNPRWMYDSGSPERYFHIGEKTICIHPAPAGDTDTLEITAVITPNRYTSDTDRIQLRNNLKWGVVHYAVGEYYAGRGDAKTATYHHGEYLKRIQVQGLIPYLGDKQWQLRSTKTNWQFKTEVS